MSFASFAYADLNIPIISGTGGAVVVTNGNRKISSRNGPKKEMPSLQSRTCSTRMQAVHSSAEIVTNNATQTLVPSCSVLEQQGMLTLQRDLIYNIFSQ